MVLAGQDIAPIPSIKDPGRRARADKSFRHFCDDYFPDLFCIPWSDDHLRVIAKIERTVIDHETFAVAMPRGSGKTTLCQVAVIWALVTGRHPFVFLIAATSEYALALLENIKKLLAQNDRLYEDYPEAIHPIRCLEGESRRCGGQRYYGRLTGIKWMTDQIVLANIPNARCSEAVVHVAGLTGNIRGAVYTRSDGTSVRPTLAVIDDPQTDQSARSVTQCRERLAIINGAILGLAGPKSKVATIMPCTVIRSGDVADKVLDRDANPQWQGERTRLVNAWPTNEPLWNEYARLRAESFRAGGKGESATAFYRDNRAAMDEGSVVAWTHRFNADELSGIQHAMNIKLDRGAAAFAAEFQNEPIPDEQPGADLLSADDICRKLNGHARGTVPTDCTTLTLFVDVQQRALYWMVVGWTNEFSGFIVDYGTEPEQHDEYFSLRTLRHTLAEASPRAGMEAAIYAGLESLAERTLGRNWQRDDGAMVQIDGALIDANWGMSTGVVYQFCRQSKFTGRIWPSHGHYVGASGVPFSEYKRRPGEKSGLNWRKNQGTQRQWRFVFDSNFWKSFVHARLAVSMGDPGCLSLFGHDAEKHRLMGDHLTSEYRVQTHGRGRTVDEWKPRVEGIDNHWLDCLVGCAVAASVHGVDLAEFAGQQSPQKRVRLSELQARKQRPWSEKYAKFKRMQVR